MYSYCSPGDVLSFFSAFKAGASSPVSEQKINGLISQWSAYITGALRGKYSLPITDETDLELLRGICARLTAGDIDDITNDKSIGGAVVSKKRDLKGEALKMLEEFMGKSSVLNNDEAAIGYIERGS
jgi:hypothetical protein